MLELGCGNGYITHGIYQKYPNINFTLLDGNLEMLNQAKTAFQGHNFIFIHSTFEDYIKHCTINMTLFIHQMPFII